MKNVPTDTVERWRSFTDLVISHSRKGLLSWKETSTENQFLSSYKGFVILLKKIDSSEEYDGQPVIEVSLEDKNGMHIDEFNDEDISDSAEHNYYQKLNDLILVIERQKTGADQVLDRLISDMMDDEEKIPF